MATTGLPQRHQSVQVQRGWADMDPAPGSAPQTRDLGSPPLPQTAPEAHVRLFRPPEVQTPQHMQRHLEVRFDKIALGMCGTCCVHLMSGCPRSECMSLAN